MPKIKLFSVKATVKNAKATIDHSTRKASETENLMAEENFNEENIAKKAQEVATFNNIEITTIESMGDDDYWIDFKIIV